MASNILKLPDELSQRLQAVAAELGQDAAEVASVLLARDLATEGARLAAVDAAYGAFAGCPGNSKDLALWRREEAAEEEQRDRERWERWRRRV